MFLIESNSSTFDCLELYSKFSRILFSNKTCQNGKLDDKMLQSVCTQTECWIPVLKDDSPLKMIQKLDLGVSKIILPLRSSIEEIKEWIQFIPKDRLIVSLNKLDMDLIQSIQPFVSGILIDSQLSLDQILSLCNLSFEPGFFICKNIKDVQDITQLDTKGIDVVLNAEDMSWESKSSVDDRIYFGDLIVSMLKTDRPDGLFTTIVANEHGTALGLCYSSKESICESIRTGEGVYFSRNRGLWYKGKTSGATQKLKSIQMDCDRDTLRFIVYQTGSGLKFIDFLIMM